MTTLGPARRTPLCGAWWRSDLWAPRIRAPSQCVPKAPRPQLPFQALPKISNTRPMLPRAFPRRPRSTQRHPRGFPRTTQRTDFGLLSRLLAPQQPKFYLRNSRILTCSSLLLQAPSLCSEKLSDEPSDVKNATPDALEGAPGAPRSLPPTHLERSAASPEPLEPSKKHLRSHLTVQSHLRRLHEAPRSFSGPISAYFRSSWRLENQRFT